MSWKKSKRSGGNTGSCIEVALAQRPRRTAEPVNGAPKK